MRDYDDQQAFQKAVEREAVRIAAAGEPSDAGRLVLQAVMATLVANVPHASEDALTAAGAKAIFTLARTDWDAATNAMALVMLTGADKLVASRCRPVTTLRRCRTTSTAFHLSRTAEPNDDARIRCDASEINADLRRSRSRMRSCWGSIAPISTPLDLRAVGPPIPEVPIMSFPREGGCQCGAVRYVVDEPPKLTFACHCTDCQRRSGSAVVVSIVIRDSAFRITRGYLSPQTRINDQGRTLKHWFCAECGTPLLGVVRGTAPDLYQTVRVGTLDNVHGLPSPIHVWTRSAQDWIVLPPDAKGFEANPTVPLIDLAE